MMRLQTDIRNKRTRPCGAVVDLIGNMQRPPSVQHSYHNVRLISTRTRRPRRSHCLTIASSMMDK